MKVCCACKVGLELCRFSKNAGKKDGLASKCKDCSKAYSKEWNIKNNSEQLIKKKEYRNVNKERIIQMKKCWYQENKESCNKKNMKNYYNNIEIRKAKSKEYYLNNREKGLEDRRNHYTKNKEKYSKMGKQWRKENRGLCNFYSRTYEIAKKQATPKWLTKNHLEEIKEFYQLAQDLKWLNEGETMHIDHIVPIQGEHVCGLHVPWNLQILTAEENHKKNNKFETHRMDEKGVRVK